MEIAIEPEPEEPCPTEFGECLGDLLRERGLHASDLARLIHVDKSLVQKWVNGTRIPETFSEHMINIRDALRLSKPEWHRLVKAQVRSRLIRFLKTEFQIPHALAATVAVLVYGLIMKGHGPGLSGERYARACVGLQQTVRGLLLKRLAISPGARLEDLVRRILDLINDGRRLLSNGS